MNMKLGKVLRWTGIVLIAILVLGTAGMYVWAETGTYPAKETALDALESTEGVTVTQEKYIVFAPTEETERGLIFYPGGLVEPTAYAPVLHMIAEEGVLVVIPPMPFNLAIFGSGAADAVMEAYPQITEWTIAGHSLGGAAAAIYAEKNPDSVNGIAFWDSYPPDSADLSETAIAVLSIYGTTEGVPNTDGFDSRRELVPEDTIFAAIAGANHAQFGDYGPQKGDVEASISLAEQHEKTAALMLDFLFREE